MPSSGLRSQGSRFLSKSGLEASILVASPVFAIMFLSDPQMVSTLFLGLLLLAFWQYRRKLLCLPPGPSRRHPGDHALVFQPWKTFYQWNKTYGTSLWVESV